MDKCQPAHATYKYPIFCSTAVGTALRIHEHNLTNLQKDVPCVYDGKAYYSVPSRPMPNLITLKVSCCADVRGGSNDEHKWL